MKQPDRHDKEEYLTYRAYNEDIEDKPKLIVGTETGHDHIVLFIASLY